MLEFDLHQGWSKGLRIGFENIETSEKMNPKLGLGVEQYHSSEIHILTERDLVKPTPIARADGIFVQGDFYKACKRPLVIKTADCIPLFFVDKETESLAAIHAGWRGLAQGIHTKLFHQGHMNPKTVWAWAGPSMSGEGFNVRADMWSQFKNQDFFKTTADPAVKLFDAWGFLEYELEELGVHLVYNVEVNTFQDPGYHSYRRASVAGEKLAGHNYSWCRFF